MPDSVHKIVRDAEQNYLRMTTRMSRYVSWSMHDVIETIDAYLNSKHISGPTDSLGRDKPFFNISVAASNIWFRATNIDRKDIRFTPQSPGAVILAFVANILLQKWMDEQNFGKFLKDWGIGLARYGSAVVKFIDKGKELRAVVVPWNRLIPDSIDFDSIPRVEKFYKTPGQLKEMATKGHPNYAGYDMEQVKAVITSVSNRKTLDKDNKDTQPNFIELYEVHGLMDSRLLLKDQAGANDELENAVYVNQMHVISFYGSGAKQDEWDDFTLYKGKEAGDPYMISSLIEEDGRTLAIGAVEYLFDAQWQANHTIKNQRDTLDIISKIVFQTEDSMFAGRNVLSALEAGDILTHQVKMPLETVNMPQTNMPAMENYLTMWMNLGQDVTSTPDAMRGNKLPSGTSYSLGAYQGSQASSLFDVMTENKGLALEQMLRRFVIPHLKKQLKHSKEIMATLDDAQIKEIDSYYVPYAAVQAYNKRTIPLMLQHAKLVAQGKPAPPVPAFDQATEENNVRQSLAPLGNKRSFKPSEFSKKQWADIFSDFEWNNIKVEITNENQDKQATLTTLSTVLQTVASNPAILQDPNAKMLFGKILMETGIVSPLEITSPPPPQPVAPGGGPPSPGGPPLALGAAALPPQVRPARESAAQLIG